MGRFWRRLLRDETGGGLAEYALMAALIGAALVGVVTALGQAVGTKFTAAVGNLK